MGRQPCSCTPIETTRRPPSRFSHTNEATFGARCRPNASLVGGHVTIRPPCSSPRQTCVALFGYDPKRADATHFCHISWVVAGLLVTCAARHQLRAAAPRWGCLGANGTREAVLGLRWTRRLQESIAESRRHRQSLRKSSHRQRGRCRRARAIRANAARPRAPAPPSLTPPPL